jgi:hypothetical protein
MQQQAVIQLIATGSGKFRPALDLLYARVVAIDQTALADGDLKGAVLCLAPLQKAL